MSTNAPSATTRCRHRRKKIKTRPSASRRATIPVEVPNQANTFAIETPSPEPEPRSELSVPPSGGSPAYSAPIMSPSTTVTPERDRRGVPPRRARERRRLPRGSAVAPARRLAPTPRRDPMCCPSALLQVRGPHPIGPRRRVRREQTVVKDLGRMDWVRDFYARQYEWADWRRRWSGFDPNERNARVDAVTRHAGPAPHRILELGSGTGTTAAALASAGHSVVAIEMQDELAEHTQDLAAVVTGGSLRAIAGDFYEVDPPGTFDVVAYFDGFGIGTDEDQVRLLHRIVGWLAPGGCALVDVLVPSYWARQAGNAGRVPAGQRRLVPRRLRRGVLSDERADVARRTRGRRRHAIPPVLFARRLPLVDRRNGASLVDVEPFTDETYGQPCSLEDAMLYLATLAAT